MITEYYPYYDLPAKAHYVFESLGDKKSVFKVVILTLNKENIWNLGFGDLKDDGFIDDSVITNNRDAAKVIRTVAKIAIDFLVQNPTIILEIKPVDEKRKRLYNSVFQRYFIEIDPIFDLFGILEKEKEIYKPSKFYDGFQITFKSN
jgi:hypothetical protein